MYEWTGEHLENFVIINSLYLVFHYLFRGRFFLKKLGSSHSNLRIE